jgi:polysaccharide export outer membrane protein
MSRTKRAMNAHQGIDASGTQHRRTPHWAIALFVALAPSICGCQVLSTDSIGISPAATVTSGLGGVAAMGDPAACEALARYGADGTVLPNRPPAELTKVSLPTYRVEPPDVLLINAISVSPPDPYFIQPLDILQIVVAGALPEQPIAGTYQVEPSGLVSLGPSYGPVKLEGLTIDEAIDAITRHLGNLLQVPEVSVSLLQPSGQQQVAGEHLVGPDGTVSLGIYGAVYVAGMTLEQTRHAIEEQLSEFFNKPKVSVDVFAYNSKVFYIITEGAGFGDQVLRVPSTGNETVLDAISQIGGISRLSSTNIWISRPSPNCSGCDQIIPIDWDAITRGANTCTNYQILPGDRVFLAEDRWVALDGLISKLLNPVERILGFSLLGAQTIQSLQRFPGGTFF